MLPKKYRLSCDRDFKNIYQRGKTISSSHFVIRYIPNREVFNRFGMVISKKISNKATIRNRLRRQIAAVIEKNTGNFNGNYDVAIIAKRLPADDFLTLGKEILYLFGKIL